MYSENILAMVRELSGWSRPKGCLVCGAGIFVLGLTTALGFSVLRFQPFAAGTTWLDFWDFVVSTNILPRQRGQVRLEVKGQPLGGAGQGDAAHRQHQHQHQQH